MIAKLKLLGFLILALTQQALPSVSIRPDNSPSLKSSGVYKNHAGKCLSPAPLPIHSVILPANDVADRMLFRCNNHARRTYVGPVLSTLACHFGTRH